MKPQKFPIGFILAVTVIAFLFGSCKSPTKLLESGDYDRAINIAVKKLKGKKHKKAKHVKALEIAFAKVTKADMKLAKKLKKEGRPENWEKINDIHRNIIRRQDKIEPLLPLVDKNGYKAIFRFVKIEDLELESKKKTVEFLYSNGKRLLERAEKNHDKTSGRKAYDQFKKIEKYYKSYKDNNRLMARARNAGVTHILIKMKNDAGVILPDRFEREIMRFSVNDMNELWRDYSKSKSSGVDYDYNITIWLTEINVSPDAVKERQYIDEKEIEDGFQYVLDANGNVAKDSSGNDIKIPKKIIIRANVIETFQHKEATVAGRIDFRDNYSGELLDSKNFAADAIFDHYASTFNGDRRALSEESKSRIGNRPIPFPRDEDLILDAADELKPVIKRKIENNREIY